WAAISRKSHVPELTIETVIPILARSDLTIAAADDTSGWHGARSTACRPSSPSRRLAARRSAPPLGQPLPTPYPGTAAGTICPVGAPTYPFARPAQSPPPAAALRLRVTRTRRR